MPGDALFLASTDYHAMSALSLLKIAYDVPIVTSNLAALQAVKRKTARAAGTREWRRPPREGPRRRDAAARAGRLTVRPIVVDYARRRAAIDACDR